MMLSHMFVLVSISLSLLILRCLGALSRSADHDRRADPLESIHTCLHDYTARPFQLGSASQASHRTLHQKHGIVGEACGGRQHLCRDARVQGRVKVMKQQDEVAQNYRLVTRLTTEQRRPQRTPQSVLLLCCIGDPLSSSTSSTSLSPSRSLTAV